MEEHSKFLFLFRLSLRILAFGYPLFLTVMYNFWIFTKIPSWTLMIYVALMGAIELAVLLFNGRLGGTILPKIYVVLTIIFEFPSAVVGLLTGGWTYGYVPFLVWALLWYSPVFLIAFITAKSDHQHGKF
ncbi:hypothetical protein A3L09_01600 [Thermococcus profundus]|uniref:Uncharacterized protein n=1 Tax=Thermococcus profundus TaxID=49899 RepID=A0A2Z2M6P2_THEPR|nr:hypothetical protein [Thermococcus profundus]ASJ02050.1 hypothetical protein A3L09_01600 [Thermococcus profundus]